MCRCGRHRTPQGCAGARHLSTFSDVFRRMTGREGGKTRAVLAGDPILARYAHLGRDQAILQARLDGIAVGRARERRLIAKGQAA
jgi:hypothetical protein